MGSKIKLTRAAKDVLMAKSFEFFFDYVSPTAYLALPLVKQVTERTGADLIYRPMFLGGVMQATGNRPPGMVAAKGAYMNRDLQRCAEYIGVPMHMNPHFPMNTLGLLRATVGLEDKPATKEKFIEACFRRCWGSQTPMNPATPSDVAAMCDEEGFNLSAITALASDPANKEKVRANTDEAVERGVFGAPSFFVGDDLFFGHDRLDYVERALA
jgi:2-hydroxychromene-2-carboxylate isomerase